MKIILLASLFGLAAAALITLAVIGALTLAGKPPFTAGKHKAPDETGADL